MATNVATNLASEGTTNESGLYVIGFLQPGTYTVTVEHPGFKKSVRENVVLGVSQRLSLDMALQVGQVTDSVTVSDTVSLLQTETATRISFVERNLIEKVPNNGRNPFLLTHALPGVTKSGYWGSAELYAYGQVGGVSIGGGRIGENETVIDGVTDTRPSRGVNFIPALDSLSEISVQTNVYDAQFGRTGGGVNVFSSKSGTNALHGAAYYHFKDPRFTASGWGRNKAIGTALGANPNVIVPPKTYVKNHTRGFEVDGPVVLPKLWDGRNRMFFMISYENLYERNPQIVVKTLPTDAQAGGDFSALRDAAGRQVTIHDPLTTDAVSGLRAPFAGNRIPSSRINPIATRVASFYPKPNLPGEGAALINNYSNVSPSRNAYEQWTGKLDYRINSRNNVFLRYGRTPWDNFALIAWGTNEAEPSGEAPSNRNATSWAADWTSTLNPVMVLNVRAGLARTRNLSGNIYGVGYDPAKLGFNPNLVSQYYFLQFPRFQFAGAAYSELGTAPASEDISDSWSLQPNVNWVRGKHTFKIGSELRLYNQNNYGPGYASGLYAFDRNWTRQDARRADASSGNEFATFLLGYPTSGQVDRNINPARSWRYYSTYIQDDWKVSPRLTINLGFRWDYEAPATERFDRQLVDFAFDQPSPIAAQVRGLNLRGGLIYASGSGNARQAFNRDLNNFQPRAGVAWRVTGKLVFRGGYGLMYLGQQAFGGADGYSRTTPVTASVDGGLTPRVNISNAFPEGLLEPVGNSRGLAANLGQAANFPWRGRGLPHAHQFSAGFQHELPWGMRGDVSYVGNITSALPLNIQLNYLPASELGRAPSYYSEQVANPMAGLLPDNAAKNGATITRQNLLMPYPQYTGVTAQSVPIGRQRYDAMQSSVVKRFSHGLSMLVNLTISKTLEQTNLLNDQDFNFADPNATRLEKRLVDYDPPVHFGVVASYDLPFG
ncbi:MAG: carboxypeptidase regulatory-like domain-containing protein, partial [Bryobacteraceae bacterium]